MHEVLTFYDESSRQRTRFSCKEKLMVPWHPREKTVRCFDAFQSVERMTSSQLDENGFIYFHLEFKDIGS